MATMLDMVAQGCAERVAFGPKAEGTTYSELAEGPRRATTWIGRSGLEPVALVDARGEQVAGEYLGRAGSLVDGWPTNDGGYLHEGGFLFVEGRFNDVIVQGGRGGENLSPGDIEEVLIVHPAVADIAVVGIPDTEWGEKVATAVVVIDGLR